MSTRRSGDTTLPRSTARAASSSCSFWPGTATTVPSSPTTSTGPSSRTSMAENAIGALPVWLAPSGSSAGGRWRGLGAAQEAPGALARGLVALAYHDAPLHLRDVAPRPLHEPAAAGRQVVDHLGRLDGQGVEVDDVDVGQVPGRQQPPVVEPVQGGGAPGLEVHGLLEAQTVAPVAVAHPVAEHVGG